MATADINQPIHNIVHNSLSELSDKFSFSVNIASDKVNNPRTIKFSLFILLVIKLELINLKETNKEGTHLLGLILYAASMQNLNDHVTHRYFLFVIR